MTDLDALEQVDWRLRGACRRLTADLADRFFFGSNVVDLNEGRALCAICPVRNECLEFADGFEVGTAGTKSHMAGIWGGLCKSQRIARRRVSA